MARQNRRRTSEGAARWKEASDGEAEPSRLWLSGACHQEALAIELAKRSIPSLSQPKFPVCYKGQTLEAFYKPDFICFDAIVVELKALSHLTTVEEAQVINYLKVTGFHIALLLNFGSRSLEKRRFIWT